MPTLGGGLWCCARLIPPYGKNTWVCLLSSFFFIQDHVSKVLDGVLVYVFHEGFDVSFGDFKVG